MIIRKAPNHGHKNKFEHSVKKTFNHKINYDNSYTGGNMFILDVKNVKKIYGSLLGAKTQALTDVSFQVSQGEFIAIMGESGSGKTTLLNIISTLDKATEGSVLIAGNDINKLKDAQVSTFRRNELGFVFQDFNLLDTFSNRDNIYLPLVLSNVKPDELKMRLDKIAPILGIAEVLDKFPYEISGGQKQRIAIARAIITNPKLLLADEPTGALDSASSDAIMSLFEQINASGQTILMVTHSTKYAAHAKRVLFIKDGRVFHEIYKGDDSNEEFIEKINQANLMLSNRKTFENEIL